DILRTLDVARHPINRICNAAQQRTLFASHHATPCAEAPRTQVSLLPPPCDEFTTSEPFLSATRVSPPGRTKISFPYRMYGRRSTWRPSNPSPTMVGTRESESVGWAM